MDAPDTHQPARATAALIEWALVGLTFYTLLSYPFYLKYAAYGLYQAGFLVMVLCVIVVFAVQPRVTIAGVQAFRSPRVAFAIALYVAYLLAVGAASLLNGGDGYLIAELGRLLIKFVVGVALIACLTERTHRWMLDRYADVMVVAAIAGTTLVVAAALGWLSPIATIHLPSAGLRDDGVRDVYLLGFTWGALPIPGGGKIIRLQSFADEPGTFAFGLLVALVWAVHRRRFYSASALTTALILTWSVGALLAGLCALSVYLWRRFSLVGVMILTVLALMGAIVAQRSSGPWSIVADRYLQSKLGSAEGSSLGDRLKDIGTTLRAVERHPLGLGGGAVGRVLNVSLGVGWGRSLAEGGIVGFTAYLLALGTIVLVGLGFALRGRGDAAALGSVVVILAVAAFQRARMDESIWHWWLMAAFIRSVSGTRFGEPGLVSRRIAHSEDK